MEKTLGGDRLGSGKKLKVELHGYSRSTHDLSYLWRSTMSAGTLVPFMSQVCLPGDTFDIDLEADVKTLPTVGPLFGSFKMQMDIFQAPIRLYHAMLHNNRLGIGMNMSNVKLPFVRLQSRLPTTEEIENLDNFQINPSCLLAYLGIRGAGLVKPPAVSENRDFNGVPFLAYWDIYKNYYANKQEENAYCINTAQPGSPPSAIISVVLAGPHVPGLTATLPLNPSVANIPVGQGLVQATINCTSTPTTGNAEQYIGNVVMFQEVGQQNGICLLDIAISWSISGNNIIVIFDGLNRTFVNRTLFNPYTTIIRTPRLSAFPLANIDAMRDKILQHNSATAFRANDTTLAPYWNFSNSPVYSLRFSQQGLALKTYQSDLFNNWLKTDWIDGVGGITEVTAIDTSGGSFTIDTLNLSKKVYDMLNRIAVSGGSYDDWIDAVYTHDRYVRAESPIYHGGLIKEVVFQEVISNSEAQNGQFNQPLGTLAGRGVLSSKHKGGKVVIHVDEPSYIIGIVSLTPRIDYSQGNSWDMSLETMNDLHKPALDEIGFQELITEQMAWWDTSSTGSGWVKQSAGKQPAWINYMTAVNKTYGNFAIENNQMFMTLNRRYQEGGQGASLIADLTTYIDPKKFNFIFAETELDAQNFWVQIAVGVEARRKMSAKLIPNL